MLRRLCSCALVLASLSGAIAGSEPALARGARHANLVLDANTGAVLSGEDADELRHPASLTKMMTLYLTFETIESGRLANSDKITISQEAANAAPSNLGLDPGEEIAVGDAIRALITKSANDIAVALAEKVGGSQANFVRLMNTRARDLGMTKTNFENASGLPNKNQVTTARDMVTLGLRLQDDFPGFYPLFATRAFTYNGSTHRNHNTMLNTFQGIDGIKTGYTSASGFNLVSSVHRGGRHVVAAVFGGSSAAARNAEMRNLLTRALTRASTVKTRKPAPSLIARLKSAPKLAERPKAAEKAKLQVAAAEPMAAPKPFAPAKASKNVERPVMTAVAAPVTVAAADVAPTPIATVTPLEVFKVKRVIVAPRQGPKRPPPSADETTDMVPEDAQTDASTTASPDVTTTASVAPENSLEGIAKPFTVASADAATPADSIAQSFAQPDQPQTAETIIPKAALERRPTPLDDKIAMLGASDTIEQALVNSAATPVVETAPEMPPPKLIKASVTKSSPVKPIAAQPAYAPLQRGQPPSSLQAQAAMLSAPQGSRVAAVQPSPQSGRFEIQIGAFGSVDEAQRALTSAQSRAGKLLASYASVTHPTQKDGRQIFRARFTGFNAQSAANTCNEMRRQAIDCFVMSSE